MCVEAVKEIVPEDSMNFFRSLTVSDTDSRPSIVSYKADSDDCITHLNLSISVDFTCVRVHIFSASLHPWQPG